MPRPKEKANRRGPGGPANGLPAETAVPFYLILIAAILLPALLVVCVVFAQVAATILLAVIGIVLAGSLIYAYRAVGRQMHKFHEAILHLPEQAGEQEISVLGGILKVRIEEPSKALPPTRERSEGQAGSGRDTGDHDPTAVMDLDRK